MKRVLKWIGIAFGALIVVACVVIYGVSEYRRRETFDIAATPIGVANDSASLALGRHIFETRGCTGCHGEGAKGKVLFDEPWLARIVAPNVPKVIRGYSDPELARVLRHGVRPNGRGVALMPSAMFYHLDDTDLAALIAYLRTLPEQAGEELPSTSLRLLARVGLAVGQYRLEPRDIVHDAPRVPKGPDPAALGQYLAKSSCTECHGQRLQGDPTTPALSIVAGYSRAEFGRLMRDGVPKDGRTMELMTPTAKNRFSHFTEQEVDALYEFLSRQLSAARTPKKLHA